MCFYFLSHTRVPDENLSETPFSSICSWLHMLALHISIKLNWKVLSCCVRGSSVFQSLESKVVSASSTLKVSNVCSWLHYYHRCHTVLGIKIVTCGHSNESYSAITCVTILEATYFHTWHTLLHCAILFHMNVLCNFLPVVGTPVCVTIKM